MVDVQHWDDVASYQGAFQPTRFTVCKATQGTNYINPTYAGVKSRCASGKHHFATYHFLEAGNAAAQAAYHFKKIGKVPSMLDIETYDGSKFPSLSDVTTFIAAFRKLGGIMNITYIPQWFWAGQWKSTPLTALHNLSLKNINSNYSAGSSNQGSSAFTAFGGLPNLGVQYTSTPHDMNVAYMSFDTLWQTWTGMPIIKPAHPLGSRILELRTPYMTGADVTSLQQKIGVQHAGKADGIFGGNTHNGLTWWQMQHHISADGVFGPETAATMGVKWTG